MPLRIKIKGQGFTGWGWVESIGVGITGMCSAGGGNMEERI